MLFEMFITILGAEPFQDCWKTNTYAIETTIDSHHSHPQGLFTYTNTILFF